MDSPPGVDLSGDRDCNCLGYDSRPQQYFLSQQKSLELRRKQSPLNSPRLEEQMGSIKNSGKRSLRKAFRPGYESPQTARTIEPMQEYYSQKKIAMPRGEEEIRTRVVIEERRTVNFARPEKEAKTESRPPDVTLARSNRLTVAGWQQIPSPAFYAPPLPLSPPRVLISLQQQPPPPIRINFSHSPPSNNTYRYSPLPSPREFTHQEREEFRKPPTLSDLKEQLRINIAPVPAIPREHPDSRRDGRDGATEEYVDFQLTEDNMDSPRHMPIDRKKHTQNQLLQAEESIRWPQQPQQFQQQQSQYFAFGETFKSRIDKPKSSSKKKDPYRSRIDPCKSRIDTAKSRIDPKKSSIGEMGKSKVKSLREDKRSLKKMDDVEEIRSMVDSDELSDEDKESVVLGRLHEYGSMLDPSLSLTTPTLRSKLISMNTQSSTIGKSFLRPFEFSIERTHFK